MQHLIRWFTCVTNITQQKSYKYNTWYITPSHWTNIHDYSSHKCLTERESNPSLWRKMQGRYQIGNQVSLINILTITNFWISNLPGYKLHIWARLCESEQYFLLHVYFQLVTKTFQCCCYCHWKLSLQFPKNIKFES